MSDFVFARQPIGTDEENNTGVVWCGGYFDATGYARRYQIGSPAEAYHTGADLNCNLPKWDSDRLAPVYSIMPAFIMYAITLPVWGNVIIARHVLEDARVIYARYAHVLEMTVRAGETVNRGQQIARIGNADGKQPYHLHFDISPTDALARNAGDWPKLNLTRLKQDYADPLVWTKARIKPLTDAWRKVQVTADRLNVRNYPRLDATIVGVLTKDALVEVENTAPTVSGGFHWQRARGMGLKPNLWIALEYTKPAV